MTEAQIISEQNNIGKLRQESKQLILPRRSIAYQFQYLRNGNRNFVQRRLINQRQRRIIRHKIEDSQKKVISLREVLLGR